MVQPQRLNSRTALQDSLQEEGDFSELSLMNQVFIFRETRGPAADGYSIAEVIESTHELGLI